MLPFYARPKCSLGFLVTQMVKNPPAMQETWVPSLGREDLLKKEIATHSSILAWEMLWTEEPGGLQCTEWQRVGHDGAANAHTLVSVLPNTSTRIFFFSLIIVFAAAAAKLLQPCPTLCDPIDSSQAPPSLGFSRQEHWSGLPFPSPVHESEK